uniref:Uncharacterized protein n=1 Tax=Anopheles epiroticus TaxID=199890 RepID=A0A182PUC5_9DIPT
MKDGMCSKRFPKPYCNATRQADDGYPIYRRRNDGRTVNVKEITRQPIRCALQCHKYNCHINVEECSSLTSVKYLNKYVYKGHDRGAVSSTVETTDKIQQYLDARYVSTSLAKTVIVVQLPVHLEYQHNVMFRANDNVASVLQVGHHTMLTRLFELMSNDVAARSLTYQEVSSHYRFAKSTQRLPWYNGQAKQWILRVHLTDVVIGRMVYCPMSQIEWYYLRLMLRYRKGPTSFDDLWTVDSLICATFQQAPL